MHFILSPFFVSHFFVKILVKVCGVVQQHHQSPLASVLGISHLNRAIFFQSCSQSRAPILHDEYCAAAMSSSLMKTTVPAQPHPARPSCLLPPRPGRGSASTHLAVAWCPENGDIVGCYMSQAHCLKSPNAASQMAGMEFRNQTLRDTSKSCPVTSQPSPRYRRPAQRRHER